jgi:hypothetical protein
MAKTPKRRESDKKWIQVVGWAACLLLAGSLTYTFVQALVNAVGTLVVAATGH